jgi:DNA-binding NarL/FixJ family response regulator
MTTSNSTKVKPTRIMLVDDHPVVRQGLADSISKEADLVVCAEAEERHQALGQVERSRPDLLVVDLSLKNSSGMELIKDVRARWPHLPILVVSMHDENLYAERVLRAGARGFITKQEATRNILGAIRRVLSGQIYLNEKTASAVLSHLTAHSKPRGNSSVDHLAERELQVFELTGEGMSIREIGERLHIDVKTVETYRARIKEKLNLRSSSELLQMAIRWNKEQ